MLSLSRFTYIHALQKDKVDITQKKPTEHYYIVQ